MILAAFDLKFIQIELDESLLLALYQSILSTLTLFHFQAGYLSFEYCFLFGELVPSASFVSSLDLYPIDTLAKNKSYCHNARGYAL